MDGHNAPAGARTSRGTYLNSLQNLTLKIISFYGVALPKAGIQLTSAFEGRAAAAAADISWQNTAHYCVFTRTKSKLHNWQLRNLAPANCVTVNTAQTIWHLLHENKL